jgi:hypothetical protein
MYSIHNFEFSDQMTIVIILFLIFTSFLLWIGKKYEDNDSTRFFLLSGWILKCAAGLVFIYVYTYHYGNGILAEDSGAYMAEAKKMVDIKKENSFDYYSILFNFENSEELISNYFKALPNSRISRNSTGFNDTRNHIKTISVLMLFVGKNTPAIFALYFFLSYLGFAVLWISLKNKLTLQPRVLFGLLFLTPSLLFWTSSNLKEAVYILGICLITAFYFENNKSLSSKLMAILGVLLVLLYKPILLLILAIIWFLIYLLRRFLVERKMIFFLPFLLFVILSITYSLPNKFLTIVSQHQFDFINVARGGVQVKGDTSFYFISAQHESNIEINDSTVWVKEKTPAVSNLFGKIRNEKNVELTPGKEPLRLVHYQKGGGSYFNINPINNSWSSFFVTLPSSLFNTFIRPLPFNGNFNIPNILFFAENLFFLGLLFLVFFNLKNVKKTTFPILFTLLLSIVILAVLIGITTPSIGALLRYRIPIQLLIIIVYLMTKMKDERTV